GEAGDARPGRSARLPPPRLVRTTHERLKREAGRGAPPGGGGAPARGQPPPTYCPPRGAPACPSPPPPPPPPPHPHPLPLPRPSSRLHPSRPSYTTQLSAG